MNSTPKNKSTRKKSASKLYEAIRETPVAESTTPEVSPLATPETPDVAMQSDADSATQSALTASQDFEKWAKAPTMEQLADNLRHDIEFCMAEGCTVEQAFRRVQQGNVGSALDIATSRPLESLGWKEMRQLENVQPGNEEKLRKVLLDRARAEIKDGRRGARAIADGALTPMQEARYLALVEELSEEWEPRNGIERTLIQQMTQSHMQYLTWLDRLNKVSDSMNWQEAKRPSISKREPWLARITQAEAATQAAVMVERFQKIFLRTQRALRDLRRHAITIERVDQLNVGDKQVNIKEANVKNGRGEIEDSQQD